MSTIEKGAALSFNSARKQPSRKLNPIMQVGSSKKVLTSSSKNKLSLHKSAPRRSKSKENLKFQTQYKASHSKNGESEASSKKLEGSEKQYACSETYSFESETESQSRPKIESSGDLNLFEKTKSLFGLRLDLKKSRKSSQSIYDVMNAFHALKSSHEMEEREMLSELNVQELHRLRKIYAAEEAQAIFRAFDKSPK